MKTKQTNKKKAPNKTAVIVPLLVFAGKQFQALRIHRMVWVERDPENHPDPTP